MGQSKSQFSEEELQDYQDLTYFTKKRCYNMMSVLVKWPPKSVKAEMLFEYLILMVMIMLGVADLKQVITKVTGENKLRETEMSWLIQNILEEADLDDDGALSFARI
ncbi:hypothetical protein NQ317_002316 [Molorchus minor]|uniref:EF-hand domain-containing protein n=1 Tax=Molorchus minor TaxID=1323400 RepID=A0ABQ9J3T7_9CUCU|nr:hypothetical protein NQ317_002316 [Molorchus minor]